MRKLKPLLIYLAGPDVFSPNAMARGEEMKRLCTLYGHHGIFPLDGLETVQESNREEGSRAIWRANVERIQRCDVVAANLNPFRGMEPDSGTAFEVGYAIAQGKPVVGYLTDDRPLREQLGGAKDREGCDVEDFDLPVNLMIGVAADLVRGTLGDVLTYLNRTSDGRSALLSNRR